MSFEAGLLLLLVVAALVAFVTEIQPVEVTALALLGSTPQGEVRGQRRS